MQRRVQDRGFRIGYEKAVFHADAQRGSGLLVQTGVSAAGRYAAISVLVVFLLLPAAGAADIETALGDTVHLSGYAYEGSTAYLFLTGPNLPASGVSLDDLTTPADSGGLTRVDVDANDHWSYDWDTTGGGRVLDAGTYTVWITTEPVSRSRLRGGDYRTLSVTLRNPGLSPAATAPQTGAISFRSSPDGASVTVSGEFKGKTPFVIENISPGTYRVAVSKINYYPLAVQVTVASGGITEVNVTLSPNTGTLTILTEPSGALILLDGRNAGTSPVTFDTIPAGNHTIAAQMEGYSPTEKSVTVAPGGSAGISLVLVRAGETVESPTPRSGTPFMGPFTLISLIAIMFFMANFRNRDA